MEGLPEVSNNQIDQSGAAAQATAMIQSRFMVAIKNPRHWDSVRQSILNDCKRPSFANNKSAIYRKPIGGGVEGLGIRFVEAAFRHMRNVLVEVASKYDDEKKEVVCVSVTDLETNATYTMDVTIHKTVERSRAADDGTFISKRKNSRGRWVYTVPATDEDLLNKRLSLISKAIRTMGLRIIPGDIQDEATAYIKETRRNSAAKDPEAGKRAIIDAFADIGIKVSDLEFYIGHSLDRLDPAEIEDLRTVHGTIKDGESTWESFIKDKEPKIDKIDAKPLYSETEKDTIASVKDMEKNDTVMCNGNEVLIADCQDAKCRGGKDCPLPNFKG